MNNTNTNRCTPCKSDTGCHNDYTEALLSEVGPPHPAVTLTEQAGITTAFVMMCLKALTILLPAVCAKLCKSVQCMVVKFS